jgi:MFS family permease
VTSVTPAAARRRFVWLSLLRWLPSGLLMPVFVLLPTARGLSLATVGALFGVHSLLVAALELPTGGLADAWGRRNVLLLSGALSVATTVVFAFARDLPTFTVAMVLLATGRALGTGPLEAWYVDTVHATDPDGDIRTGISRGEAAEALGLCAGAVGGGFLPRLFPTGDPAALFVPLSAPALLAGVLLLGWLLAVAVLVTEPPRPAGGGGWRGLLRDTPATVRAGIGVAASSRTVRLVLLSSLAAGAVLSALEVLTPVRFAGLLGGTRDATGPYGLLVAAAFLAVAGGSAVVPVVVRLLRSLPGAGFAASLLGAAALGVFAAVDGPVALAAAYVLTYLALGVLSPVKSELLHQSVGSAQRATVVSVRSLAAQAAGAAGALTLPALAAGAGYGWAFGVSAGLLALGGLALLAASPRVSTDDMGRGVVGAGASSGAV